MLERKEVMDVPVNYEPDDIPDGAWNYIIHVKPDLAVLAADGQPVGFRDDDSGHRSIVNDRGEVVGSLPPGLAHWGGSREDAEEFIKDHPSGDCLCVVRVLMLVHPEDI